MTDVKIHGEENKERVRRLVQLASGEPMMVVGPDDDGNYAAMNERGKGRYGWVVYGFSDNMDPAKFPDWPPRLDKGRCYAEYRLAPDTYKLAVHPCRYKVDEGTESWSRGFAVAMAPGLCDVLFIVGEDGRLVHDVWDYRFTQSHGIQAGGMYLLDDEREVEP